MVSPQTYDQNVAITPLVLPEATGGTAPLRYSLEPDVPGLQFDSGTRTLSGMPTTAGTYDMTYTATDADGDVATLSFTVTVAATTRLPEWPADVVDNKSYFFDKDVEITPLELPKAIGGAPPLRYSLTSRRGSSTAPATSIPGTAVQFPYTYTERDADHGRALLDGIQGYRRKQRIDLLAASDLCPRSFVGFPGNRGGSELYARYGDRAADATGGDRWRGSAHLQLAT